MSNMTMFHMKNLDVKTYRFNFKQFGIVLKAALEAVLEATLSPYMFAISFV